MALFARICVLRGFPAAAYRKVAFLSRFVMNRKPTVPFLQLWMATKLEIQF